MNTLLLFFLRFFARAIISRHRPYVFGMTGTVGKTTITTYVARYLELVYGKDAVLISPYHYNGEYGLPLTIIGAKTGGKNPFLWIGVFLKAIITLIRPYPRYLVLEYGIDHPGEMEYLLSIVKPDIAIISPVAPNHLEQFGTLDHYRDAKLLLASSARSHSIIHDSLQEYARGEHVYSYGKKDTSDATILSAEQKIDGIDIYLTCRSKTHGIRLPSFGAYQGENILPLYLIAHILDLDADILSENGQIFTPEEGRSRILRGKSDSTIIDGSYNGGFESICRGIDSLAPFLSTHRIICLLGDMRELGEHTEDVHVRLSEYLLESLADKGDTTLFLVGPLMEKYASPLLIEKIPMITGRSSRLLGKEIYKILESDPKPTIIYVKGSQNTIFLEEGVKEFLAHPGDDSLLCRQSKEWMKKKEEFFRGIKE